MTSQSYSADVTGFRVMTSECVSAVPIKCRHVVQALLASHSWLASTSSQLRQVNQTTVV